VTASEPLGLRVGLGVNFYHRSSTPPALAAEVAIQAAGPPSPGNGPGPARARAPGSARQPEPPSQRRACARSGPRAAAVAARAHWQAAAALATRSLSVFGLGVAQQRHPSRQRRQRGGHRDGHRDGPTSTVRVSH
jgi:hypothetical protein